MLNTAYIYTYLNPANTLIRVVLPAPDGPIIAVSSPERNSPLTDFKINFFSEIL